MQIRPVNDSTDTVIDLRPGEFPDSLAIWTRRYLAPAVPVGEAAARPDRCSKGGALTPSSGRETFPTDSLAHPPPVRVYGNDRAGACGCGDPCGRT